MQGPDHTRKVPRDTKGVEFMFERVLGSVSSGIAEDHPQGQAWLVAAKALICASQCQSIDLITLGLQGSQTILDHKEYQNLR